MYIISLLVHEKKDVVLDQLQNFKKYFPSARVVIHVSKGATFSIDELSYFLKNKIDNYEINPVQIDTNWGSIILAHFENIKFASSIDKNAKILFHSSNDMFIRYGVESFLHNKRFLFNQRFVYSPDTLWWTGRVAIGDENLLNALKYCGSSLIMGTQIEGTMFEIDVLLEIIDMCNRFNVLDSPLCYPREEIIFSSFSNAIGIKPDHPPYLFSEVHRFDRFSYNTFTKYPLLSKIKFFRKIRSNMLSNGKFYKITEMDIENIRNNPYELRKIEYQYDGESYFKIFSSSELYAIKRVERDLNNNIRKLIRDLD